MGVVDPDLPPSYTEATTSSASPAGLDPATGLPPNSPLTLHLRSLPERLQAARRAKNTAASARAADLTTLCLPHIESFLADVISRAGEVSSAELTLVPAGVVPKGAEISDFKERVKAGELIRVVHIEPRREESEKGADKKKTEQPSTSQQGDEDPTFYKAVERGFDEWGWFDTDRRVEMGEEPEAPEKTLWFRDEDMANRIASYLRPEPNLKRKHVQAIVVERKQEEEEQKGGWKFALFGKGKKKKEPLVAPPPVLPPGITQTSTEEDDLVKMTVKAEEVTFRRENEFGIWETKTGWGVVVSVKVKE
ncbi:hypothetical protein VTJ04DRAFT_2012 [Mycothermus thermophilus]|uniref:uncharacterized protein n=1 Tax=Humicola insolens TaxID=85995 RepID=UPI003742F5DB